VEALGHVPGTLVASTLAGWFNIKVNHEPQTVGNKQPPKYAMRRQIFPFSSLFTAYINIRIEKKKKKKEIHTLLSLAMEN